MMFYGHTYTTHTQIKKSHTHINTHTRDHQTAFGFCKSVALFYLVAITELTKCHMFSAMELAIIFLACSCCKKKLCFVEVQQLYSSVCVIIVFLHFHTTQVIKK